MDNLRLILIVVATLAIVALLIHGFWINKKERSNLFSKQESMKKSKTNWPTDDDDDFVEISDVRVVAIRKDNVIESGLREKKVAEVAVLVSDTQDAPREEAPLQHDLFMDAVMPHDVCASDRTEEDRPMKDISMETHPSDGASQQKPLVFYHNTETAPAQKETLEITTPTDVLVLHVAGINGTNLNGGTLLNSILSAGFQYGDMQIFHRHIDPAGNGAILFSLANMVKPGHLTPETMPEMITPGVSLFMMLPSFGDDQQNFKMLLQAAQRIADDVKGVVLDDEHHMLTPQKIADYKERIKKLAVK